MCGDGKCCAAIVVRLRGIQIYVFVYIVGPGLIPIQMMTKGFVQGQLDKLHTVPKYLEVLEDDGEALPTKEKDPVQDDPGEASTMEAPVAKRTRTGTKTPKAAKPPAGEEKEEVDPLKGFGQLQAEPYNLNDMGEVLRLVEFLAEAGWELFLTPKDGNCLYGAFRRGMELPDEYRSQHLRNQLVLFVVKNHKYFYDLLKLDILIEYGQKMLSKQEFERREISEEEPLTQEEREAYNKPGPFSFYSYLAAVLDSGFWGDSITINIISRMWQVAITILGAEQLSLTKIRHRRDLENTHFILILAGGSHYLGACKYQFHILFVGSVVRCCAAMAGFGAAMAECCVAMVFVPLCIRVPGS